MPAGTEGCCDGLPCPPRVSAHAGAGQRGLQVLGTGRGPARDLPGCHVSPALAPLRMWRTGRARAVQAEAVRDVAVQLLAGTELRVGGPGGVHQMCWILPTGGVCMSGANRGCTVRWKGVEPLGVSQRNQVPKRN